MWTARSDEFVHVSSFNRPILVTNQNTGLLKELWLNVTQRGLQVQNYIFTRGGVTLLAGNDSSALSCLRSVVFKGELQTHTHTHTHTHTYTRLTAPFPGLPGWGTTRKVKTNLDFTEARDSEWQWHQLGHMQVCTSLQTDNHANTPPLSFYRPYALPAAQPTASKHWRQQ